MNNASDESTYIPDWRRRPRFSDNHLLTQVITLIPRGGKLFVPKSSVLQAQINKYLQSKRQVTSTETIEVIGTVMGPHHNIPPNSALIFVRAELEPQAPANDNETLESVIRNTNAALVNSDVPARTFMDDNRKYEFLVFMPDVFLKGQGTNGHVPTGGPGAFPLPVPKQFYEEHREDYRQIASDADDSPATPPSGDTLDVHVYILDALPDTNLDIVGRVGVWWKDVKVWPAEDINKEFNRLFHQNQQFNSTTFHAPPKVEAGAPPAREWRDHGLFITDIVRRIEPKAHLYLFEALNHYLYIPVSELYTLIQVLQANLSTEKKVLNIVNMSFMFELPVFTEDFRTEVDELVKNWGNDATVPFEFMLLAYKEAQAIIAARRKQGPLSAEEKEKRQEDVQAAISKIPRRDSLSDIIIRLFVAWLRFLDSQEDETEAWLLLVDPPVLMGLINIMSTVVTIVKSRGNTIVVAAAGNESTVDSGDKKSDATQPTNGHPSPAPLVGEAKQKHSFPQYPAGLPNVLGVAAGRSGKQSEWESYSHAPDSPLKDGTVALGGERSDYATALIPTANPRVKYKNMYITGPTITAPSTQDKFFYITGPYLSDDFSFLRDLNDEGKAALLLFAQSQGIVPQNVKVGDILDALQTVANASDYAIWAGTSFAAAVATGLLAKEAARTLVSSSSVNQVTESIEHALRARDKERWKPNLSL